MFGKLCEFIFGIIIASLGLSGWIILVQNNAQGDLAFVVCMFCIFMFVGGLVLLADACGFIED